jgi:hypothetical protein
MYAPVVKSAKRLHEFILDANHSAVLLGDIVSDAERGPDVGYRFLMVVFDRRWKDPVAFISSETNRSDPGAGSHYLCAFLAGGRRNFGAHDDWADRRNFEPAALQLAKELAIE